MSNVTGKVHDAGPPVFGSVATTLSPVLTFSIGLVEPSAISTKPAVPGARVGGKTGTAQHGLGNTGAPYAWFIAWAQAKDSAQPAVTVAVVVEDAAANRTDILGGRERRADREGGDGGGAAAGGGGAGAVRNERAVNCQKTSGPTGKRSVGAAGPLCGTSDGVISGGDADPDASDHFERVRIEVELKPVSRSFAVVHVAHKKAPLAHFGKTRKAFRGPGDRPAAPLRGCHPAAQDAPKPRHRNGVEPDVEMRSRKQCILGLNTDLGSGLPCSEQFTRGYFVHLTVTA